jgi:tetratricopeptide (TPR) repeat protein
MSSDEADRAQLDAAIRLFKEGKLDEALASLELVDERELAHMKHYNRGLVLAQLGRLEEALDAFHQVRDVPLKLEGFDSAKFLHAFYSSVASVLVQLSENDRSRLDDAISCYEYALQVDATDAATWHDLGIVFIEYGMPGEAIAKLEKAVELEPAYHDGLYYLAIAHEQVDELDEAIDCLKRALLVADPFDKYTKRLASLLVKAGKLEEAKSHVEGVLIDYPADAEMLGNMVIILHGLGDAEGAKMYYKRLRSEGADLQRSWLAKIGMLRDDDDI